MTVTVNGKDIPIPHTFYVEPPFTVDEIEPVRVSPVLRTLVDARIKKGFPGTHHIDDYEVEFCKDFDLDVEDEEELGIKRIAVVNTYIDDRKRKHFVMKFQGAWSGEY